MLTVIAFDLVGLCSKNALKAEFFFFLIVLQAGFCCYNFKYI